MKHTRQQILVLLLSLGAMFPLGVSAQVVIITQPQSQSDLLLGDSMTLRVQATGSGPLSYQWRLNGVNIPGANNASFPIAGFQSSDSGDYSVAVSDDAGAVSSAVARVREKYPPELPFTDNMNGLCAGLGILGSAAFAASAARTGNTLAAAIGALTSGALAGFLPWNYPRATVFLGDVDWEPRLITEVDGRPDAGDLILNQEEGAFVIACWLATAWRREHAQAGRAAA